jgi:hypothetical protein
MSERKQKRRKRWLWSVVALLIVLYPLSTGPAYWICHKAGHGDGIVTIAYVPLFLLADKWRPFDEFLWGYIFWWSPVKLS